MKVDPPTSIFIETSSGASRYPKALASMIATVVVCFQIEAEFMVRPGPLRSLTAGFT